VTGETDQIATRIDDGVGFLTLDRPKAINSLNQTMVTAMSRVSAEWERDDGVRAVVPAGAGDRGLCAGSDVVAISHSARADGVAARSRPSARRRACRSPRSGPKHVESLAVCRRRLSVSMTAVFFSCMVAAGGSGK
jgi:enoyl-CoA hydratase/carnithine racemase